MVVGVDGGEDGGFGGLVVDGGITSEIESYAVRDSMRVNA